MFENQNIEWKESWRDEYLKWICGFANAQGGKIYIGKNDDGVVVGVENSKKLLEDIPNKVRDVLGIIVDVNLLTEMGKECIEIDVKPNGNPVNYKGEYHYRSGSTKQQLRGQALNQFLLRKMGFTWDSVPIQGVTVQELRNDSFDIFKEKAILSKRIDKIDIEVTNEQLLDSLNLLENNSLKRAAILLFHHNPEKWIPGAYIKIGYFESESELRYQDEIHGSLISQADRVVDLIFTKYLKAEISYCGVTRIETYPFPKEAIREAVFNAIAHKFYGALIPIQIKVYKDKIYIANDCIFPEDWTIDDLMGKHRSRPYNPLIANTFFRAGFIEAWGRGIEKIKDCCKKMGNPMPEYTIKHKDIMVLFKSATTETNKTTDLEKKVTNILHEIGFPAHILGYRYLREAIVMSVNDMNILNCAARDMYPSIAKKYDTTPSRVERAIRHAIEVVWNRKNSSFDYMVNNGRGKPTNLEFIAYIADMLQVGQNVG